jgi:hypothetical protein
VQRREGLFDALLEFGNREYDILVVNLECLDEHRAFELPQALQRQPATQGIAVVGVGTSPELQQAFLAGGADMVAASGEELEIALGVVTGMRCHQHEPAPTHRSTGESGSYPRVTMAAAQAS